jgi:hypothetical protein
MKALDPDWPVFIQKGEDQEGIVYGLEGKTDTYDREYEIVGSFLENDDFYQGLCMITVIRRKSDGKLFGYSWWNDISKHGEAYIECNGDEYGLESDVDTDAEDFDWEEDYETYWVFEPVVESSLVIYNKEKQ